MGRVPGSGCGSIFLGFVLLGILFLAGCQKQGEPVPAVMIKHEITPQPPKVGLATILLRLSDAAGQPIKGAQLKLEATMSHPGMRPVFGDAKETDAGRYQSALEFTMAGDWIVLVHVTLPNGQKVERQLNVTGVQPG